MKRPAFQFYPGDWLRDAHLRICSAGARALWIDMIAIMHQADPYGHLVFNGKALDVPQLARMIGETPKDVARWLKELEENGVPSRNEDGVLFSRRMVRDEAIRDVRASGGRLGAEHGLKGAWHGKKGGRPRSQQSTGLSTTGELNPPSADDKGGKEPPLKPPPSSSSSTSEETPSQVSPAGSATVDNPIAGQEPGKAEALKPAQWWDSEKGWIEEGKRRGVEARKGEPWDAFRDRVKAAGKEGREATA